VIARFSVVTVYQRLNKRTLLVREESGILDDVTRINENQREYNKIYNEECNHC